VQYNNIYYFCVLILTNLNNCINFFWKISNWVICIISHFYYFYLSIIIYFGVNKFEMWYIFQNLNCSGICWHNYIFKIIYYPYNFNIIFLTHLTIVSIFIFICQVFLLQPLYYSTGIINNNQVIQMYHNLFLLTNMCIPPLVFFHNYR